MQSVDMRVGLGYDVHRLAEGRPLIIGGVKIDYPLGLLGHSDADVLIHAVIDALLGAANKGDIGAVFPDSDPQYKGISSVLLLERVHNLIKTEYNIINIDCVVAAQEPRLRPYIAEMAANMARALEIEADRVSVKATTEEGLGFTGSLEGIKAEAICLLEKKRI